MEKPCEKCYNKRVALGWSECPQLTERGSGQILASAYIDRLLNDDFYPADKQPEENLEAWPVCPVCCEKVPIDDPYELNEVANLPDISLTEVWVFLGLVFSAFLLLLFLL